METVQREMLEGGFLIDCLEVGSNDLKSFIEILKDLSLQFNSSSEL